MENTQVGIYSSLNLLVCMLIGGKGPTVVSERFRGLLNSVQGSDTKFSAQRRFITLEGPLGQGLAVGSGKGRQQAASVFAGVGF